MKRFYAIVILLFYLISVSGATLHVHFCGKKLQNISIAGFEHSMCCCGKVQMEKGCCKEKLITFKAGGAHKSVEHLNVPVTFSVPVPCVLPSLVQNEIAFYSSSSPLVAHSPPIRAGDQELFVLHRVFRI